MGHSKHFDHMFKLESKGKERETGVKKQYLEIIVESSQN